MTFNRTRAAAAKKQAAPHLPGFKPHYTLLAAALHGAICSLALGAMTLSQAAYAQNAAALPAGAVRTFNVPAGPLDAALDRFARAAGVNLSYEPALIATATTKGLVGNYSNMAGLSALLAGSGFEALAQPGGGYLLRKVAPAADPTEGETMLPTIKAKAQADTGATTEGTGSYTTGSMDTATKLPLSLRETPQSVSVLTRQQMDEQGATTLDDAVQAITGLTMQKGNYVGDSGSFSARGFEVANLLLDGLPTSTGANGTFNADNGFLDIYDRVEVVRGATGLTTGAGTPSAAINLVRKRPVANAQASVSVSAGSWNNFRTTVDAGGPLNATGTLRGRTVVAVQDTERFYDTAHDRNHQFYGILETDLTSVTVATLGLHYTKVNNDGAVASQPTNSDGSFLSGLSRSTNLSNDFDYWNQTDQTVFAELTHQFSNGWQAKAAAIWKRPEQDLIYSGLNRSGGVLYQSTQRYRLDNQQDSYDVSLNGPFSLLGRAHKLMFGASYRKYDNKNWGGWADYSWTTDAPVVDPYNWDSSSVAKPDIDMSLWGVDTTARQKGMYAATRLNITDPLKVILGMRLSWYDYENHLTSEGYDVNNELTPYAGAIYELNDHHSVYASWTEIFQPQSSVDQNGDLLEPITGTNYEIGVKGEYFGGRLNASLATFVVKQQNRATDDLSGPNPCPGSTSGYCQRASGEVESKGIELEIGGALTPNWQIMAGYTYVATKYTKDSDASNIGKLFNSTLPRHQLKLTTSYRLPGEFYRWRIGGNLYAQNSIHSSDSPAIEQPSYAIAGLNFSYSPNSNTEIRLNINNMFDKNYYQNIGWYTGGNTFGAPRNALLSLSSKF